jgi:O-antigen/teichoic acid export membrane protein
VSAAKPVDPAAGERPGLIGAASFVFLCRLAGAGMTFVIQVLLARWVGAAELGIYIVAFSWCLLLSTLAGGGFSMAAIRFIGAGIATGRPGYVRGYIRRGSQVILGTGLVIATLAMLASRAGAEVYPLAAQAAFFYAMLAVPLYGLMQFQSGVANAFSRLALSFTPNNVWRPLLFLLALFLFRLVNGSLDAEQAMRLHFFSIAIVTLGTVLLLRRVTIRALANEPREYDMRVWLRAAPPLLAMEFFGNYFPEVTVIALGSYLPSHGIAVYSAAFRAAMLITFALNAIDASAAPRLSMLHAAGDPETLRADFDRATWLRFRGGLLAVVLLGLFGEYLLALFGPDFVAGYRAMLILALAQLVTAGAGPTMRMLTISGHQNQCLGVFIAALLLTLALIPLLVPRFGIEGAAVATGAAITFWSLTLRFMVARYLGIRPSFLGITRSRLRS